MYCNKCGAVIENAEQEVCTSCGSELYWVGTTEKPPLPMKWHKFLVYFALIFSAVLNLITAIGYLTGFVYEAQGLPASDVYLVFPPLKTVDLIYAALLIAYVVFDVYVWWNLKGFKKNAYRLVPVTYLLGYLMGITYEVVAIFIMVQTVGEGLIGGLADVTTSIITSVVMAVIMVVCNKIYYKKRAHLFIN